MTLPEPTDEHEEKTLSHIKEHGLSVIHVFHDKEDLPDFTYSAGLWHSYGHPEVLIIGLKRDLSGWIVNEIALRIRDFEEKFEADKSYDGFLEGFECKFLDVPKNHYREYISWDLWLYGGDEFPLLQCVWPSTSGVFPWDKEANDWLCNQQPVLKSIDNENGGCT